MQQICSRAVSEQSSRKHVTCSRSGMRCIICEKLCSGRRICALISILAIVLTLAFSGEKL